MPNPSRNSIFKSISFSAPSPAGHVVDLGDEVFLPECGEEDVVQEDWKDLKEA